MISAVSPLPPRLVVTDEDVLALVALGLVAVAETNEQKVKGKNDPRAEGRKQATSCALNKHTFCLCHASLGGLLLCFSLPESDPTEIYDPTNGSHARLDVVPQRHEGEKRME